MTLADRLVADPWCAHFFEATMAHLEGAGPDDPRVQMARRYFAQWNRRNGPREPWAPWWIDEVEDAMDN